MPREQEPTGPQPELVPMPELSAPLSNPEALAAPSDALFPMTLLRRDAGSEPLPSRLSVSPEHLVYADVAGTRPPSEPQKPNEPTRTPSLDEQRAAAAYDRAVHKVAKIRVGTWKEKLDPTYWAGRALHGVPVVRDFYLRTNANREIFDSLFHADVRSTRGSQGGFDRFVMEKHGVVGSILAGLYQEIPILGDATSAYKGLRKIWGVRVPPEAAKFLVDMPGYNRKLARDGSARVRDIPMGIADIIGVIPGLPEWIPEIFVRLARDLHFDEGVEAQFAHEHLPESVKRHTLLALVKDAGIRAIRERNG